MRILRTAFLTIIATSMFLAAPVLASKPGAPKNVPTPPSQVCYKYDAYDDYLMLSIIPGQRIVNGVYRFEIGGGTGTPPSGPAHALLAGTIQDVLPPNTLPNVNDSTGEPGNLNGLTQISLNGSVSSGIWNFPRIIQCWMHLAFQDGTMELGAVFGGCGQFGDLSDLTGTISKVPCDSVPAAY